MYNYVYLYKGFYIHTVQYFELEMILTRLIVDLCTASQCSVMCQVHRYQRHVLVTGSTCKSTEAKLSQPRQIREDAHSMQLPFNTWLTFTGYNPV